MVQIYMNELQLLDGDTVQIAALVLSESGSCSQFYKLCSQRKTSGVIIMNPALNLISK